MSTPDRKPRPPDSTPSADGRHRRSQRSRERILAAVAGALKDPQLELTPERVAAEAGVSLSTIFRHFGDMDGLAAAMRERVAGQVVPILAAGPFLGDARQRVGELVRRRAAAFEIMAPLLRATLRQSRPQRAARETEAELFRGMRRQLEEALAGELVDADLVEALDALLSLETWVRLRQTQGLAVARSRRVLEGAATALLEARGRA